MANLFESLFYQVLNLQQQEKMQEANELVKTLSSDKIIAFAYYYDTCLYYDAQDNEAQEELAEIVAGFKALSV